MAFAPRHVAIIMDGNGRWATRRGLPRTAGHRRGADAVRRTVESACERGLRTLTLYAFSSDNWRRPRREVGCLMALFRSYLESEAVRLAERGVRLTVIGRRDRLPGGLVSAIDRCEESTRPGCRLDLGIAVDYSSRDAILAAAARAGGQATRESFQRSLGKVHGSCRTVEDVDLLVRTGGEQRLSDFLLWECAYAELVFMDRLWPDFGAADLDEALEAFRGRDRRFGGLSDSAGARGGAA